MRGQMPDAQPLTNMSLATQLGAEESPFTVVVMQHAAQVQWESRVHAAIAQQTLAPVGMLVTKLTMDPLDMWRKILPEITTPWIVRIDGNVVLQPGALEELLRLTQSADTGAILANVHNDIVGPLFTQQYNLGHLFVYRKSVLESLVVEAPTASHCSVLELLVARGDDRIIEPFSRTIAGRTKGRSTDDPYQNKLLILGEAMVGGTPEEIYQYCYRLGNYDAYRGFFRAFVLLMQSMSKHGHPLWPLAFVGYFSGTEDSSLKPLDEGSMSVAAQRSYDTNEARLLDIMNQGLDYLPEL